MLCKGDFSARKPDGVLVFGKSSDRRPWLAGRSKACRSSSHVWIVPDVRLLTGSSALSRHQEAAVFNLTWHRLSTMIQTLPWS